MSITTINILLLSLTAIVAYAYAGYPAIIWLIARCQPPRKIVDRDVLPTVSVILPVLNEQDSIVRRLVELRRILSETGIGGEIIVVSDGSTDQSAALARANADDTVRVLELPERQGKAAAISAAVAIARSEVIVFADVRQRWSPDTLRRLVAPFADRHIGAVGGELIIESAPGVLAGMGAYWRYEKWLRRLESAAYSTVGVSGSISAVRRELFRPIPRGTILDDMYWPLCVAIQGFRVVHEDSACAFDRLPALARDEFRRKVRTLSGIFQLCARLPALLLPWKNPVWFQLFSHKLMRLLVPWALIGILVLTAITPGRWYQIIFLSQVAFYLIATVSPLVGPARVRSLRSAAGSFLLLNAAAWVAFWVWISGRTERSWTKSSYAEEPFQINVVKTENVAPRLAAVPTPRG